MAEKDLTNIQTIMTSNINKKLKNSIIFNYSSFLGEGDGADNAGAMIIRILKKAGVNKIRLAGFDGFDVDSSKNYCLGKFAKNIDFDTAKKKNEVISKQLKLALDGINYEFITETKYEI